MSQIKDSKTATKATEAKQPILRVLCIRKNRQTKDGSRSFVTYRTCLNIIVKGEEDKGFQKKYMDLRFDKAIPFSIIEKLAGRNYIYVYPSDIQVPEIYQVTTKTDAKTGKTKQVFPHVFVTAVRGYERTMGKKATQDCFITDEEGSGNFYSLDESIDWEDEDTPF